MNPQPPPLPGKTKKERSPAQLGGLLAVGAAFIPLLHPSLFFLLSLPMLFTAFLLAIVAIVKGRVTGGIFLLIGLLPAFMMSFTCLVDREKLLHHPEQLRESR
jgi:undecaprenyl pyrophosphate phosphatase UppP